MPSLQVLTGLSAALVLALSAGCVAAPNTVAPNAAPIVQMEKTKTVLVSANGEGDYKTVGEAIGAAPPKAKERWVIRIAPGTYREKIRVPRDKGPISLIGQDAATTILTFDDAASTVRDGKAVGTSGSYSLQVQSRDFSAENITIENSAGQKAGQAVALYVDGDRASFRKCRILGWQDTLYTGSGRHYFEECLIAGSVDYIFGGSTAWFEKCELNSRGNGKITAASTPPEQPFGYVFSNCTLTTEPGVKAGLGRTWRPAASVTFLNTVMPPSVDPKGWDDWGNPENQKTARYAEYNSRTPAGEPVDVSGRASWAKQLTAQEAAQYTIPNVLGGVGKEAPFGMRSLVVTKPTNPIEAAPGVFPAQNVTIYGTNARLENNGANIGFWNNTDTSFEWTANVQPGTYKVTLTYGLSGDSAGSEIQVVVGNRGFQFAPPATRGWGDYQTIEIGEVEIGAANTPVAVSALSQKGDFILNLREVTLSKTN